MTKHTKIKYSFILIFLVLSISFLSSQNHLFSFDFFLEVPLKEDLKSNKTAYITGIEYNWKDLQCSVHTRLDSPKFDISLQSQYLFNFFSKHNIGVFGKYHFYFYENEFNENDWIYGIYYQINNNAKLKTQFFLGHMIKCTNFLNLDIDLLKHSLYGKIAFIYNPIKSVLLYTNITTCDTFEFLTFGSLFINTGGKYDFTENLATILNLSFKLVDAFTVSTHLASFKISPTLRITL